MEEWPAWYYILMKSPPGVPGDKPRISMVYKYRSQKVPGVIVTYGGGSTEPGVTYLPFYPDNYPSVSICPVIFPRIIGIYLISCNAIYNNTSMW